jgi:hypothetical protein
MLAGDKMCVSKSGAGLVGDTQPEAGASQHAKLDLRHVEPTAVLEGVVELQPFHDMPGFSGGEGLMDPLHMNRVINLSNGEWRRKDYFMLSAYGVGGFNMDLMGAEGWRV